MKALNSDVLAVVFDSFFPQQLTPFFYVCKSWSKAAIQIYYNKIVLHENTNFTDILHNLLHIFHTGYYPYASYIREVIILAYHVIPLNGHDKSIRNTLIYDVFQNCRNIQHFSWNRNRMEMTTMINLAHHWPMFQSHVLKSIDDPLEIELLKIICKSLKSLWYWDEKYKGRSLSKYIMVYPKLINLHISKFTTEFSLINKINFPCLQRLCIENSVVDFKSIPEMTSVTHLSLLQVSEMSSKLISSLSQYCPFLEAFELSDASWTRVQAESLNNTNFNCLVSLKLLFNDHKNANLYFDLPKLRSLTLVNAIITESDATTISQLNKLEELKLRSISSDLSIFSIIIFKSKFTLKLLDFNGFFNFKLSNEHLCELHSWNACIILNDV